MSAAVALGLDAGRAADPARYRLGAAVPRLAVRPADRDELAEALRAATGDGLALVPWGGGVGLAHQPAPERYDLALDLTGLDRIVEYDPEDLTLTAECGVTIQTLRRELAARGQELPLEGARADRATLGGVLAANASGPRRLRFGSTRDRILGARFALGDGTLVRTGGRVVKNVAGYGIHRLLCGSRGGLAVIVEASLKLVPAPARRAALVYFAAPAWLAEPSRWRFLPRLEPAAVTVVGWEAAARLGIETARGSFLVIVGLEDDGPWVESLIARIEAALADPSSRLLDDGATAAMWRMCSDLEDEEGPRLTFASPHNSPADLAPLLEHPAAARMVFHAPAGRLHLFPEASTTAAVTSLLGPHGFVLIEARGAGEIEPQVPPSVAARELRARIRVALDPGGRMALGGTWERCH